MNTLENQATDVNSFVDSLNIDDELIGNTISDDGKSVSLAGGDTATDITDNAPAPAVTVATVGAAVGTTDAAAIAKAALEKARNTQSSGSTRNTDGSKHAACRPIFVEFYGKKTRKEIINLYIAVAGCTEKGAATYYQQDTKDAKLLALVAERDAKALEDAALSDGE